MIRTIGIIRLFIFLFFSIATFKHLLVKASAIDTDTLKSQSNYESQIKYRLDSLQKTVSQEHVHYSRLIETLYQEYKDQYLGLGGSGKWEEALSIALASEALLMGHLDAKEEADLIYNIGYIYDKLGQYLQGIDYFHRSITLYKAIQELYGHDLRNDIALAYNNIGVAHAHTGFFTQRKESYLKAKEIWESMENVDKSYLISLYGNLLRLYRQYGDQQAAEILITAMNRNFDRWIAKIGFGKNSKDIEAAKPTIFYYIEKHRLNILYTDLISDKAGGMAHLDSLQNYFSQMNIADQHRFSAYLLTSISHAAAPLVDYDDPIERKKKKQYLNLGMQESIRLNDRYNQMIFHSRLVSYYLDAEDNKDKAIMHLDQAIQIGHDMDIREFNLLNLYLKKGDVLQKQGKFPEAERLVFKCISILLDRDVDDPTILQIDDFAQRNDIYYVNALLQAANLYKNEYAENQRLKHGRLARHFYHLSAQLFHIYYQKGTYNPWLSMTNEEINEGLLFLNLEFEEMDEVVLINLIENNRSQHLAKEFEAKYLRFLHIPDSLFVKRNLLQIELAALSHNDKAYEVTQKALSEVEAKIKEADEQYFSFFNDAFDVRLVQSALQDHEYIVRYVVAGENLYAYTIHRGDISIIQLGEKKELLRQFEQYHETIKNRKNNYAEQAKNLYNELIQPLGLPLEKMHKLVIIPEHKLNFIPFETLIAPENNQPLIAACPISYSHGLQLWLSQQQLHSPKSKQRNFAAFAPQYSNDYLLALGGNLSTRSRLYDITGATREATQLAQYFDGSLYHGDQATKQGFLQRTTDYKVYHFAMHALLDESDHSNSSLVFQNGEHLRYHELYSMHFPAELVVLSACNTGMGKLENGEGLMSLSRALTYAGVRSSVYSLWEVPDEETAEIMLSFYGHLKSGLSKAEALARAKHDFLANNPMKSHPFFWAGFVINGNTSPINDTVIPYQQLWVAGGGLFSVIILLLLWQKKRKNRLSQSTAMRQAS